jgi:hypothetical protein
MMVFSPMSWQNLSVLQESSMMMVVSSSRQKQCKPRRLLYVQIPESLLFKSYSATSKLIRGSQSYAEAQTDAVPPYWETTVIAPSDPGEIIVDDLPTGSVLVFVFNLFTSFFFQFLGFVITYFVSTTHAARYGARAGLGLTFIQYGAYWRAAQNAEAGPSREEQQQSAFWNETALPPSPNSTMSLDSLINQNGTGTGEVHYGDIGFGGRDWFALFFMTFGKHQFSSRAVQPLGDRQSSQNKLTEFDFTPLALSKTHRLGPALHLRRRLLESETVGDVDQGIFTSPPNTCDCK